MADAVEPAAKKQKTEDETAEVKAEAEEKEKDAKAIKGEKIKEPVVFHTNDTTMNVMVSSGGLLMPLSDGGIRHPFAGARASVGLKSGRYMFEAKIVEMVMRAEDGPKPSPKHVLRLGFSTSQSQLLMGHGVTDICFDMEGFLLHDKKRSSLGLPARYGKGNVLAVLINLDKASPNAFTISLFKDGKRACEPQPLPESLHGKILFPTINYRNVAVSVNFGSSPQVALPFTCNMVQDAYVSHSSVTAAESSSEFEVIFPCCLPEQGGFDWLDMFKAKHPNYTELSDRMILDWAEKSGISAPKIQTNNDKPEFRFGISDMDDLSIRRMIQCMASLQKRNYIIMEIRGNLSKETRVASLGHFFDDAFKKKAYVVMGTPDAEFKKKNLELMLKDKQEQSDAQFKKEKEEAARKKALEKKQKDAEKAKKKAEKERQKKLEEMKKAAEKAKKEAEKKKAEAEGRTIEEEEEETKDVEMEEEEVEEEEVDDVEVEEEAPKVTLTAEEKKVTFRKLPLPDIPEQLLNTSFTKFSLPELDEGFDDLHFEWSAKGPQAAQTLQKWVLERKLTSRVEDLAPSMWFKTKWAAWQKLFHQWQSKQMEYRSKVQKKATEKAQKEAKKQQALKLAEAKAAAEKAKKEAAEKVEPKEEDEKEEEEVKAEEEEKVDPMQVDEEEEEEEEAVDFEGLDIFGVDEVDDIGGGMPLYKDFGSEDWTLMTLCFELHLMSHAFKKDCDDADRKGIILEHLGFYYNRYYSKPLTAKSYGVENDTELMALAKDCVFVNKDKVLESLLDEEIEYPQVFVKIAEESRRHRALLVDMGDESAKLKFSGASGAAKGVAVGGAKGTDSKGAKGQAKGTFGKGPVAVGPMGPAAMNPMAAMANMANMAMKGGKGGFMPFGKGKSWKGK